jgi:hypothetical protein
VGHAEAGNFNVGIDHQRTLWLHRNYAAAAAATQEGFGIQIRAHRRRG